MALDSQESGPGTGGSRFLRVVGSVLIFGSVGGYMLFSKLSPKYELFTLTYDESNFVEFTMSNVDAVCLAAVSSGLLLYWLGGGRSS